MFGMNIIKWVIVSDAESTQKSYLSKSEDIWLKYYLVKSDIWKVLEVYFSFRSRSKGKLCIYSHVCIQYIAYNVHCGLTDYLPGGLSEPVFCDHQKQYFVISFIQKMCFFGCDAECNLQSN